MNIEELKKLAEAASPGPWVAIDATETLHAVHGPNGRIVADVGYSGSLDRDNDNAAYIAATNPATVLALIERIEQLEQSERAAVRIMVEITLALGLEITTVEHDHVIGAIRKMRSARALSDADIARIAQECGMYKPDFDHVPGAYCKPFARAIEQHIGQFSPDGNRYRFLRDEAWRRNPSLFEGGRAALMIGNHGEDLDRSIDAAIERHLANGGAA